ncbi:septum site-determining protein MinC [Cyanobium sp. HWJ4-Hawea]|uniref:septum site-determining protein MinC n=1 Tax=Cyanobium sp. HWJ4-Hawea TaxID=2823713 RepID=UPI0020CE8893|nr:septum site-determining protein MinC [Cyanobium sp. HWJ4-Hawea]MCP9808773.1 septum site-determining protein MinC [Cyanobium sp. HWJ4-Hawea]
MDRGAIAAKLIPAAGPGRPEQLLLPAVPREQALRAEKSVVELAEAALNQASLLAPAGETHLAQGLEIHAGDWPLTVRELRALVDGLNNHQRRLSGLSSSNPLTLVAAASLGLNAWPAAITQEPVEGAEKQLTLHQGTLRAGDHLQVGGSLLLLGDVNPGARVSAGGDVRVWGRLRGVAHAGCQGDQKARIVALQLRPLQLRIADAVARGPDGLPPDGLAEEARLVDGVIRIDPAPPSWPLEMAEP